jgi:hypothetical protein
MFNKFAISHRFAVDVRGISAAILWTNDVLLRVLCG